MDVKLPRQIHWVSASRAALTLIEVLVVVAILGLLVALLLPAVQHVRANSRKMQCQNHLKQFGIALATVESTQGAFPTAISRGRESGYIPLLPYLDAGPLREQLLSYSNVESFYLPVMICPDDPVAHQNQKVGESNYFFSKGTRFFGEGPWNGFTASSWKRTRSRDISDGLSQTVAMSERLVKPRSTDLSVAELEAEPRRFLWWSRTRYNQSGEEPLAARDCAQNRTTPFPKAYGLNMLNYRYGGFYDHVLGPNQTGCYNGPEDFGVDLTICLIPASSNHVGGVTSLLADGSVRFTSNQIDLHIWHALGTRNGSEEIPGTF